MTVVSKIESTQSEIVKVEESIKKINEDDKVKLYMLIQANKTYLEKFKYLSNIPVFVNSLKELSRTNRVLFEGFSYAD
jgi:hypothetical protein